jgi:hypothetical protein
MIVHAHSEAAAPLCAPTLQDAPAANALHATAKTVHAQAAADFWLISTLRHPIILLKKPGLYALGILRWDWGSSWQHQALQHQISLTIQVASQISCSVVERRRIIAYATQGGQMD